MLRAAADGLARRGRCRPGDKTILDTLAPAADAFEAAIERGEDRGARGAAAVAPAPTGCARRATSSPGAVLRMRLGERSVGHRDPGAVSCLLLLRALGGR